MKKLSLMIVIVAISMVNAGEFYYGGFWKNFTTVTFIPEFYQNMTDYGQANGTLNQTLRLNLSYAPYDFISLNTSGNLGMKIHDDDFDFSTLSLISGNSEPYRFDDFENPIYPDNDHPEKTNLNILGNLDRAYIRLSWFGDLYIGRQAIAWGASRMVNPTDVISPYSYDALDTEERPGVDAARLRLPIGAMSEIDLGYIAGKDFEQDKSAMFGRTQFYLLETDFSLIVAKYKKNMLYGFDMMRSIGGAGTWLEFGYSDIDVGESALSDNNTQNFVRLSFGADYSFGNNLYGWMEYHFNGAGKSSDEEYFDLFDDPAYQSGELSLMSQHYLIPGASYSLTSLISSSAICYFNIEDQSALLIPSIEYNVADDIYIAMGGYIGIGEGLDGGMLDGSILSFYPTIHSEFGSYTDMIFFSFRYYY